MKIHILPLAIFIFTSLFGCAPNLLDASRRGEIDVVEKHVKNGQDVNMADSVGSTPLMLATRNGHVKAAEILLDNGADINLADYRGHTALDEATFYGRLVATELLINRGANINACRHSESSTPLTGAIVLHDPYRSKSKVIKLLVESGADIDMPCGRTTSAMQVAENELKREGTHIIKNPTQFGSIIGISDREGNIDPEFVRHKREELKRLPAAEATIPLEGQCYDMGGFPRSCAGEAMKLPGSSVPVMGGADCIMCTPLTDFLRGESDKASAPKNHKRKCYDNKGEIPCLKDGVESTMRDNGDGTVMDKKTGLLWQRVPADTERGHLTYSLGGYDFSVWQTAMNYCSELDLAGHTGWRLPSKMELNSIVAHGKTDPAMDPVFSCPGEKFSAYFWSSTVSEHGPDIAWFVDFNNGNDGRGHKLSRKYFRCVLGP